MALSAARVLKSKHLKIAGKKQLTNMNEEKSDCAAANARASILAQEDGCVVLQVVCGCGQEIRLRCAYDQLAAMAQKE